MMVLHTLAAGVKIPAAENVRFAVHWPPKDVVV